MKHFEILCKLINALGGDCRIGVCDRSRYVYWNGVCVDYSQNFVKILRNDIRSEKKAISSYNSFMDKCDDQKINTLIKRIIKDEEHHLELLYSLSDDTYIR
jgi:bacterioferritin